MPQYSLVFIGGEGDPLASPSLPLAAALIAHGCNPHPASPFVDTLADSGQTDPVSSAPILTREHRWIFAAQSECGQYSTDTLRNQWSNAEWLAANLHSPLAQIRAHFHLAGILPLVKEDFTQWSNASASAIVQLLSIFAATPPLSAAWHVSEHRAAFPHDPLARVGDGFALLGLLRAELAKSVPLMVIRKGSKVAFVPIDATSEEEAFLLSKLDK